MADTFDRFTGAKGTYGVKRPCRAATTANITLSGYQVIDGVTFASTDESNNLSMRCLVKDQTNAYDNGIYRVNSGDWTREKDFDGNTDFCAGTFVIVNGGSANGGHAYYVSSSDPHEIGVSDINFTTFNIDSFMSKGDDVVAASTIDLDSSDHMMNVTGSTAITAITLGEGKIRFVRFTGTPVITHSASLVLPGSQNITAAAGDWAVFVGYPSGVVYCEQYQRHSSYPLTTGYATVASAATTELGSVREQYVNISGTVAITSFGSTAPTGCIKCLKFESAITITYNASLLIVPGAADIYAGAGDTCIVAHEGSGAWRVLSYTRAYGRGMLSVSISDVSTTGSTASASLKTYQIPEGAITANGFSVRVHAWGTVAATTIAKILGLDCGGTSIIYTNSLALNGVSWRMQADIIRQSTEAVMAHTLVTSSSATTLPALSQSSSISISSTATMSIVMYASAATTVANAVTAKGMTVELIPNTVA